MKASPVERRLDVTGSFIVIIIIRITAAAMAARTIELHVIIIIIIMGPANEGNSAPEKSLHCSRPYLHLFTSACLSRKLQIHAASRVCVIG